MSAYKPNFEIGKPLNPELPETITLGAIWHPRSTHNRSDIDTQCGQLIVAVNGPMFQPKEEEAIAAGYVTGVVMPYEDGKKMVIVEDAWLEPDYRAIKGTGSRMYKAFTRIAMEHGVSELGTINPSQDAMDVRYRLFQPDRIKIFDCSSQSLEDDGVHHGEQLTANEFRARAYAKEQADRYTEYLVDKYGRENISTLALDEEKATRRYYLDKQKPYMVIVDLEGLDTSQWETDVEAVTP